MHGLVLEGGGAEGAYHIGAYKALVEEGIEVQGVSGTSIGALNGAMIVQGDYERCYELWYDLSYSMVIDASDEEIEKIKHLKLGKEDLASVAEKLKTVIADKGFDITPFKNLLNTYIDEEKIRNSGKDFGIVTVNITDLKPLQIYLEDIPNGELRNYLMASAYLPIFKTEKLGGKIYLDGGIYDNLPFGMLKNKGYRDLILVRTHGMGITRKVDLSDLNAILISPKDDLGKTLEFEPSRSRRNIQLGYYDGLKALRGLKGELYYIESKKDKDYYLQYLLGLKEKQVRKIQEILKLPEIPYRRSLFEYIIPKLASMLDLDKDYNYEDLIISLLEKKAEEYHIKRFKIYSCEELLDMVKNKEINQKRRECSRLNKIIEKVDIISIFNKEQTILEIGNIIFDREE